MGATIKQLEERLRAASTEPEKIAALNALTWEMRTIDTRRALSLSEEAVCLARTAGDPAGLAPSLCLRGVCAGLMSRHEEALEHLHQGLALSCQVGDRHTEARCLQYIGRVHFCRAEYTKAIESTTAAIQICQQREDDAGLGAAFNAMGLIQFNLGDYGQALDWHVRGLDARERAGDQYGAAQSLSNIGIVYLEMEDHAQALDCHQRSLELARRTGNPKVESLSLCNLGGDYISLGRYEEALEVSRQAMALSEALEAWETVLVTLANMGQAYARTQRRLESLTCFSRSLQLARSIQDQEAIADVLCQLGTLLTEGGDLAEARARFAEAAGIAHGIGARKSASQAFRGLSEVCKRLGEYAAALGHYEAAHRLEKEVFSDAADKRAKALVVQMEVEHHRREAAALAEANAALRDANEALAEANARLQSLATTDPLTGLPNHRALVAALDVETARCRREGGPCALLFLDIDHFKSINDTYGHPVGDAVLCEFSETVRTCLREVDTLGRWGGEEFLVLLPGTDAPGALRVGERVRAAVAARPLAAGQGLDTGGLHMTCSVGVAACPPQEAARAALVEAADRALYAAKRLGRNQVRLSGDPALQSVAASPALDEPGHAGRRDLGIRHTPHRSKRRPSGG